MCVVNNKKAQRRCFQDKLKLHSKVTDKTCCVHAEQRAIVDALKNNPELSGNPYCTICSKMALDVGIKEFILLHKECPIAYNTEEYNLLSYNCRE